MPAHGAQQQRLHEWLTQQLSQPNQAIDRIAGRAVKEPAAIADLAARLDLKPARVKYGASKALLAIARKAPHLVYPWFDFFVKQLDSENSILRWNAARMLAALAPADVDNRIESVLDKYLSVVSGPQMIAAANAIAGAAEIAAAKPQLADRIARAILDVRRAIYQTDECRNIAIGHAIVAFGRFYELISDQAAVVSFVREQQQNSRSGTRTKAQAFLRKSKQ